MSIVHLSIVDKVVESWIELALGSNVDLIKLLINPVVLWVGLQLSLEVVTILLLLFGQIAEEISVVGDPSLSLTVQHSSLSSLVVDNVSHCSGIELLDFVENAIELHDGLFNFVPGFIHVATHWNLLLVRQCLELFVHKMIGQLERVDLLMRLLHLLHLVSGVNKDAVRLIIVHMDIDIGTWNGLHSVSWSVTEWLRQ